MAFTTRMVRTNRIKDESGHDLWNKTEEGETLNELTHRGYLIIDTNKGTDNVQ